MTPYDLSTMQHTVDATDTRDMPRHPYRPGFADRLLQLGRLNSRGGWLVYLAVALGVVVVYWAVKVYEGTLPPNARFMHVVLPVLAFAGLPALAGFNAIARRSLAATRPLLRGDANALAVLEYRLTTMPSRLGFIAAGLGLLSLAGLTVAQPADTYERLQIMVTPVATVLEWAFQLLTWAGVGVVGVEIARKLWVIDQIYRHNMQIRIFERGALTAFSRLSAAMVIFTMAAVAVGTIALADFATTVAWTVMGGIPSLLATAAFVAPLWGGHRLIAAEKARTVDELGERIEAIIAGLRTRVDRGELDQVGPFSNALDGLIAARNEYRSVSTWPWQISTLGGVVTAVAAPLAVWLITRVLESFAN